MYLESIELCCYMFQGSALQMLGFDLENGDFVDNLANRDRCLDVLNRLHVHLRNRKR